MDRDREFGEYVDARALVMRRTAYLLCGDWHRAEDIVQNALIKLYVAWSRVRTDAVDAYARKILVRTAIDEQRRGFFRRESTVEVVPEQITVDHTEDVDLRRALDALPPGQRAVVVLRYWEDLSIAETAHLLGRTEGTVKSQAAKGLATLKELLEDEPQSTIRTHDLIRAGRRRLTRKRVGLATALAVLLVATAGIVNLVQPRPQEVLSAVSDDAYPELTKYIKELYSIPPGVVYEDVPEINAKAFQFYADNGSRWAVSRFRDRNGVGGLAIRIEPTEQKVVGDCTPELTACQVRNGTVKVRVHLVEAQGGLKTWVAETIRLDGMRVEIISNNVGRFLPGGRPDLNGLAQRYEPVLGADEVENLSWIVGYKP